MIEVPLLASRGIEHGFGVRDATPPAKLRRPTQVHGRTVARASACVPPSRPEADAIVCDEPGVAVAVLTADCVPILLADAEGRAVAAVHAGWRGLAAGVVEAAVAELRALTGPSAAFLAAVGPHIGPCCYEVDAPVLEALARPYGERVAAATRASRPGHALLDLGVLARAALRGSGLETAAIAAVPDACTACDAARFHSFRRDGDSAGRLVHFIRAPLHEA